MRIVLVLICSFALASLALGAQEENKSKKSAPKKKQAQSAQHAAAPGGGPQKAKGSTEGGHARRTPGGCYTAALGDSENRPGDVQQRAQEHKKTKKAKGVAAGGYGRGTGGECRRAQRTKQKTKGSQQIATQGGQRGCSGRPENEEIEEAKQADQGQLADWLRQGPVRAAKGKPFKPQHFNLASKTKPNKSVAPAVNFQQNRGIQGSQNWQGSNYQVFRNYRCEWHDRDWWRHNHSRIVFVFGRGYYWNSGYWFPAWGYDPGAFYAYDGPIYAYNDLPPDQVDRQRPGRAARARLLSR